MTANDILGYNRIVILCNGSWTSQKIDQDEFSERDIAMVEINDEAATFVAKSTGGEFHFTPLADAENLIRRATCSENKEFVLIGKDTGVKERWQKTLPLNELYEVIDAMPMRRFEMLQRGEN